MLPSKIGGSDCGVEVKPGAGSDFSPFGSVHATV